MVYISESLQCTSDKAVSLVCFEDKSRSMTIEEFHAGSCLKEVENN